MDEVRVSGAVATMYFEISGQHFSYNPIVRAPYLEERVAQLEREIELLKKELELIHRPCPCHHHPYEGDYRPHWIGKRGMH